MTPQPYKGWGAVHNEGLIFAMQLPGYRRFVLAGTTVAAALALFALPAAASADTTYCSSGLCQSFFDSGETANTYVSGGTASTFYSTGQTTTTYQLDPSSPLVVVTPPAPPTPAPVRAPIVAPSSTPQPSGLISLNGQGRDLGNGLFCLQDCN